MKLYFTDTLLFNLILLLYHSRVASPARPAAIIVALGHLVVDDHWLPPL